MRLEDYFEFDKFDTKFGAVERIRVKGHRVSIEHVIELFNAGMSPERIRQNFPSLSLEEVYATITYYMHNRQEVEQYIKKSEGVADAFYQEHQGQPPPVVQRLRALRRP